MILLFIVLVLITILQLIFIPTLPPVIMVGVTLIFAGVVVFILELQKRDNAVMTTVIDKYAHGNFLAEAQGKVRLTGSKRQMEVLATLQVTMKDWLYTILLSEIDLTQYAKKLQHNSDNTLEQMAEISKQIELIKTNSHSVALASTDNASVSEEMQSSNDQMSRYSEEYMKITSASLQTIKEGKQTVTQALAGIDVIEEKMNASVTKVNELESLIRAIQDMTTGISNIAEQTNLLALNASIESARAGDAGRGFAVVAGEVTKLASESSEIAEEIRREMASMSKQIETVTTEIHEAVDSTKEIKNSNEDAVKHLDDIVQSAEGMLTFIEKISVSIGEQLTASESLADNVDSLANLAADSEEATIVASKDIDDHKVMTAENAELSGQIQDISSQLNAFVHKFDEAINEELFQTGAELAEVIRKKGVTNDLLAQYSKKTGISEFYITDENGVTTHSNNPLGIGFTIENDPETQAYVFYGILNDPNKKVAQAMTIRDIDGRKFKFIGISRTDQRGIIQLGLSLEDIISFRGQYATD